MSFDESAIFDKIKEMEPEKGSEILLSILLTSNEADKRRNAVENLIHFHDNQHFQEIRSTYLNESHSEVKIKLIELLSESYQLEGASFLKTQYKNETDWNVKKRIIEAISKIDKTNSISFLIEALSDSNIEVKKTAAKNLKGVREALEVLIDNLQFRNNELNQILTDVIVSTVREIDLNRIIKFTQSEHINIRKNIPLILGQIKKKEALDPLIALLNDKNPIVRKNSIVALEKIIPNNRVSPIIKCLKDENQDVKKEAINVLGNIGSKRSIKPLLELLKEKEEEIRKLTVRALDKILVKSKQFEEVYEVLKRRNLSARKEAVKLLSGAGDDPDAIRILIRLLNSQDSRIRRLAYKSIIKISNHKINELVLDGTTSKEWYIRKFCAKIIGKLGNETHIPLLLGLLEDSKVGVRREAVNALSNFENPNIMKKIIDHAKLYLKSSDWRLRREAVNLLAKMQSKDVIEPLISCINDEDIYVRSWAIKSLGSLKNMQDISPIINLLKDKDSKVRIVAAKALAEIGNVNALDPLINALADDNWDVRKEIEQALTRLNPNWFKSL